VKQSKLMLAFECFYTRI